MSDYNSSLPVRTENNGDVVAKIADATTSSQQLAVDASGRIVVKLDDGSGTAITSQTNGTQRALDVGINVAGVQIDPRSVRALTSADVVTANQGSANTSANGWPIKITDGTNVAAVKAASTAAAATDPALVVAISPNNTVAVTQSTSPWVTKDQSDGPVTPGTVASFSQLAGGQYNSALPTLTTGQQAALQVDSSGRLIVTSTDSDALAQGSTTSGQLGALVMGAVTTAAPAYTTAQTSPLSLTTAGALRVDGSATTQPISGTVTANQGTANATPWNQNVAQFGGSAVVTGTGTSGAGIPRVTVSSDSAILANIQVAGSAVSGTNPVPVSISSTVPGTAIQHYTTATVAAAGTSNHVYTVTALKTLNLQRIWGSASGKLKIEVQVETGVATGIYNTKFVGFNSTATPNIDITIVSPLQVAAGVRVQIIRSNLDKASEDVYTTLEGTEV
jgi:hypothetical protein